MYKTQSIKSSSVESSRVHVSIYACTSSVIANTCDISGSVIESGFNLCIMPFTYSIGLSKSAISLTWSPDARMSDARNSAAAVSHDCSTSFVGAGDSMNYSIVSAKSLRIFSSVRTVSAKCLLQFIAHSIFALFLMCMPSTLTSDET